MAETSVTQKAVASIPRFTLPAEFSNEPKEAPKAPETPPPATPAAPPATTEAKQPPATEAAATPPETPETEEEPGKETTGKDPEKPSSRRFERRIDRVVRARAEAEAKAEALQRELEELRKRGATAPEPGEPKMEDFTDINEYAKAREKFAVDRALKERDTKAQAEVRERATRELQTSWEDRVNKSLSKYDDFEEVVGDIKPTSPWAVAIMKADNGPDIAHYLGTHEREAERIAKLDPYDQIREIGKLEVKLSADTKPAEAPKKPSKAPPPIAPVTAPATVTDGEYRDGMSFEEYRKVGNKMFRGR